MRYIQQLMTDNEKIVLEYYLGQPFLEIGDWYADNTKWLKILFKDLSEGNKDSEQIQQLKQALEDNDCNTDLIELAMILTKASEMGWFDDTN